jgi:hypothetical protein
VPVHSKLVLQLYATAMSATMPLHYDGDDDDNYPKDTDVNNDEDDDDDDDKFVLIALSVAADDGPIAVVRSAVVGGAARPV